MDPQKEKEEVIELTEVVEEGPAFAAKNHPEDRPPSSPEKKKDFPAPPPPGDPSSAPPQFPERAVKDLLNRQAEDWAAKEGSRLVERLAGEAASKGIRSLALTDINNSTGILDFVQECIRAGIKPVAGIEFRNGQLPLYIGIARNNEGFYELNDFLSRYLIDKKPFPGLLAASRRGLPRLSRRQTLAARAQRVGRRAGGRVMLKLFESITW